MGKNMKCLNLLRYVSVFFIILTVFSSSVSALEIKSDSFEENGYIPAIYTGLSSDISPELNWEEVPQGVKSFAIIMDDPDAPVGTWVHWVIYNIPASSRGLGRDVPKGETLSDGTRQGINSFGKVGYGGPYPPPGSAHRYFFKLYALDVMLSLGPGATKEELLGAVKGHILAEAQIIGLFKR